MREASPVDEITDLLQHLIRSRCVNDGSVSSGHEWRNAGLLAAYLDAPGIDIETYEPSPGRKSIVARLEGMEPNAPALMLLGHTDVVPANANGWREDPFGGALIEGTVWGRGALDMLGQVAAMAFAFRALARGPRLPGTLMFVAVADEESMGTHGARWMWENRSDAVRADMVLGESGGCPMFIPGVDDAYLPIMVAERGLAWFRLRVAGNSGHASIPLGSENALIRAAEVVRRLTEVDARAQIHDTWRSFLEVADLPTAVRTYLFDPAGLSADALSERFPQLAPVWHAVTHPTLSPTVIRAGSKTNVIPDSAEVELDVRIQPGQSVADAELEIRARLGGLDWVAIEIITSEAATESPSDTPLWAAIVDVLGSLAPGRRVVPFLHPGITDVRFPRTAGSVAYGAGLFSDEVSFDRFYSLLHGTDERIDQESLRLLAEFYRRVPERVYSDWRDEFKNGEPRNLSGGIQS